MEHDWKALYVQDVQAGLRANQLAGFGGCTCNSRLLTFASLFSMRRERGLPFWEFMLSQSSSPE
jgi:hypothetical protein